MLTNSNPNGEQILHFKMFFDNQRKKDILRMLYFVHSFLKASQILPFNTVFSGTFGNWVTANQV